MRRLLIIAIALLLSVSMWAQQSASNSGSIVPKLVRFSGTLIDHANKPAVGTVGVTFSLYKQQQGGAALWSEIQNVKLDAQGKYSVLLGATKSDGLPTELFTSGQAQWLGVRMEGQAEQARVLLVSVPYALRAAEADSLAGHAAADFVTTDKVTTVVKEQLQSAAPSGWFNVAGAKENAVSAGATNFADTTTNQVVSVAQSGTGYGLLATSTSNYAIQAKSTSGGALYASGAGNATINAYNTAATGTAYGILGSTASTSGVGFRGSATATSGNTYGIMGDSASPTGTGMYGTASATTGSSGVGIYGRSAGETGIGVKAAAVGSGATMGILSTVTGANGTSLVLRNTANGKLLSAQSGSGNTEVLTISGAGDIGTSGNLHVEGEATFLSPVHFTSGQTYPGVTVNTQAPLGGNGTPASPITMAAAGPSSHGYLSSSDWSNFNGKLAPNGDGSMLSNVNAAFLGGLPAGTFAQLGASNTFGPSQGFNDWIFVGGDLRFDVFNKNDGIDGMSLGPAIRFGAGTPGEAILSNRKEGGVNQNGIDLVTNFTSRIAITNGGNIGIGTQTPSVPLDVVGNVHTNGYVRTGAEDGTAEAPTLSNGGPYAGLVSRRITSLYANSGNVVAKTDHMQIQRDGTYGGMNVVWDAAGQSQSISCTGTAYNGGVASPLAIYLQNVGGTPSSAVLVSNAQNAVLLNCVFGYEYGNGHSTELRIARRNGDSYWIGSLTSTYNQ